MPQRFFVIDLYLRSRGLLPLMKNTTPAKNYDSDRPDNCVFPTTARLAVCSEIVCIELVETISGSAAGVVCGAAIFFFHSDS